MDRPSHLSVGRTCPSSRATGHWAARVAIGMAIVGSPVACAGSAPVLDPGADTVLAHYAPGVELGMRAGAARRLPGYAFRPAPYVGLGDSTFRGPDDTQGIYLRVDDYVDDGNPAVNPRARVLEVQLRIEDSAAVPRVGSRIVRQLGRPVVTCVEETFSGRRWRMLSWPGREARVRLQVPIGSWDRVETDVTGPHQVRDFASLTFGAQEPRAESPAATRCD